MPNQKANEESNMVMYRLTEQVSTNLWTLFDFDGSRVSCFLKKMESALNEGKFHMEELTAISLLTLDKFRERVAGIKGFEFGNNDLEDFRNLKGITEAGLFDGYALPFNFTSNPFQVKVSNAETNENLRRAANKLTSLFNADITVDAVLSSNILMVALTMSKYDCLPDITKIRMNKNKGKDFQFTLRTFIVGSSTDDVHFRVIFGSGNLLYPIKLEIGRLDHISDFLVDHLMKCTEVSKVYKFDLISVGFRKFVISAN